MTKLLRKRVEWESRATVGRRRQSTATKGTGILQRSDVAVRAPTLPTNEQSDLTKKPGTMNNQELVTGGVGESGSAGDVSVGLVAATATRTTSVKDCRVGAEVVAKLDDGEVEHAAPDAMTNILPNVAIGVPHPNVEHLFRNQVAMVSHLRVTPFQGM
ncbi:hypothetical protein PInf_010859 [Phytophthora infestans]|nr:hypothetical protein PInf_010859 [Phytophthora infestans]